jgi:hypothetical protein
MKTRCAVALTLVFLAGCQPAGGPAASAPVAAVDKVHLRVPLSPLRSLDGGPQPQGVLVEVFFERSDQPGGRAVSGILEIQMYDGAERAADLAGRQPFHVETCPNSVLKEHEGKSLFGTSYVMIVPWGAKPPAADKIWLLARYVPPTGMPVFSEPTGIAIRPQ